MPYNKDDYSKAPFANGIMFDPETEEKEILFIQSELVRVAEEIGVDILTDEVHYGFNTYPERWDNGEWINWDTTAFCWSYMTEEDYFEEMPYEETPYEEEIPVDETPIDKVEENTPVEETVDTQTPTE